MAYTKKHVQKSNPEREKYRSLIWNQMVELLDNEVHTGCMSDSEMAEAITKRGLEVSKGLIHEIRNEAGIPDRRTRKMQLAIKTFEERNKKGK